MQQPPISPDYMSIPPLHPLPPSLILPHSVSHSTDAAPVNSPPRTTTPTAPSFLGILLDSDKCNGSQFVQEEAQVKSIDGSPNTPSKHNEEIKAPMIGMKFDCDDSAYEFYKQYAHRMGFSVRKQYVRLGSAGHVKRRTFCCSKEGERAIDKRREQVSFHHPISRIGCLAQMTCQLQKDGKLEVVSFHEQHNHEFAPSPMKHMLRSNRKITPAQQAFGDDAEKSGVSIKQTIDLLSMQVGGYENLGFLNVDYKNHVNSKRREALKKGDGRAVMDYFRKMQLEDPSYFYSIQLDDDNQILNIFWADSRSIVDYGHFGDVICFDTTYRTNSYGRPFAPFIGVNHHKQSIIFGVALLYDETIMSFKWLFETFLSAMSGKQPKTIFTDQSAAMANAIEDVFPESNHRLCVWHIYQNAAKRLHHIFNSSSQFQNDFSNCVYDFEDENEWMVAWSNMLETYDLTDNPWLREMFDVKEKWCMVYGRHMFTADMKSTQCSESMNSVLKKYLKPKDGRNKTQEHLVKYEASTTTVQCSCMKFSFLGILCSHALKVLDKKNVKIIPAHYVLKRWTQDAKVGSTKDYRGTDIKGNARESVGKRLCHLSHKCLQINTLAAEREMMYEHVDKSFDKLLKDLQEMRIKCCLSSMEGQVHGEVVPENVLQGDGGFESHVDISQDICGIKTKPTIGRPRGRLKSSLERKKKKSSGQKDQPKKTSGARQVQSRSGLNKVDSSANLNSHKECSNVEQPSQLVENITQESFSCSNLVGQDNVVGLNGLNQESFDCEFLVGQDNVGLYGLNQVSVDPDIDNL
ncbi:hypothetical protein SO802_023274 [Lithocarpus litseifolius]|uniref:SWIM-type domain-containing protein n=1 Tax=Lithocarpus litseifolius TaxID=425828 RepID=A0AAW2C5T8_9ROSI